MIDFRVAFDKLAQFETPDEIADFFRGEGLKAECSSSDKCAISQWMTSTTGKKVFTSICNMYLEPLCKSRSNMDWETAKDSIELTYAMRQFVYNFDSYQYPDLANKKPVIWAQYPATQIRNDLSWLIMGLIFIIRLLKNGRGDMKKVVNME